MGNKVLITGGCGFVGTNLIDYLLKETDWKINVLDNLSVGKLDYLKSIKNYDQSRVSFVKGDIRNKKDVLEAMRDCSYVFHLAAQTGVIPSVEDPLKDAEINIMGTVTLLEEAVEQDIDSFILASSAAPLGEQEMPIHEEKIPSPLAPYGASKLACEGYCSAYAGSYGLNTVVLRFSNVYGPNSWHKGSVVSKFIKQILDERNPEIYGDGEQTRDFIHTSDISQALLLSGNKELPNDFELFQIATGRETSINELYEIIKEKMEDRGVDVPDAEHTEARSGEIYRNYADISKAKKILDYDPNVELEEGIEETIDWFLENY